MRIASLVPSATETLFALGLGDSVVAVTHECDHPPAATRIPHLTRSVIPEGLDAAGIDRAVRERTGRGEALYELDADQLARLDPELIVTQALCEVCAVSVEDVRAVAGELPSRPRVLSLDPCTFEQVLGDVLTLADATGTAEAARSLLSDARRRIDRVRAAVADAERPRVVALEWLDPPFVGGHWVPEMIEMAGGTDPLGSPAQRSRTVAWEEVEAARPEVVVSMPCGYDAKRSAAETRPHLDRIAALGARAGFAVDAAAYFSRPGPRLVDGVELLANLLHPSETGPPSPDRAVSLALPAQETIR